LKNLAVFVVVNCAFAAGYLYVSSLIEQHTYFSAAIKYCIAILLLSTILYVLFMQRQSDWVMCFFAGVATSSLVFNFAIFGPVFVDRSLTYHLLLLGESDVIQTEEIGEVIKTTMLDKRFLDLESAGLIRKINPDEYKTTELGLGVSKILREIGRLSHSLDTYLIFEQKVKAYQVRLD
jgi:hypothetical protein